MMKYPIRNGVIVLGVLLVGLGIYSSWSMEKRLPPVDYTTFLVQLRGDEIRKVEIIGGTINATDKYEQEFQTFSPDISQLLPRLEEKNIIIRARPEPKSFGFFESTLPLLIVVGAWLYWSRKSKQHEPGMKGKDAMVPQDIAGKVSFADVAGIDEAKEELMETVDFLRDSSRFTRLGGRIPKGVLLQGPPGTGKTLLAKAIAGEAGVPFFSLSGSDFVEMYVGVGASRVRHLFEQAKKNSPCIIFIDEIDAVGRSRGASGMSQGGGDEREQTLNALLVEMDGFQSNETVIIVAATNRPDVLDPALLRPGRFDRQVTILPPDVKGRAMILAVHARNITMGKDVTMDAVASTTPGFTGADLANLINEAALMAARKGKDQVDLVDIEEAKDKILMGAERKGMVIRDEEKKVTAYHEAGHAIVAMLLPEADPVHKITIIPRGRAMGVTQQVPLDDRHSYSREYLVDRIKILLGGRTAEEIVFNRFTTGASNDLQVATEIATRMVCEWGMSPVLGPRAYVAADQGFLGGPQQRLAYSESTSQLIDGEINKIIEDCLQETMIILQGKDTFLHNLAHHLLEKETINGDEVGEIMKASA
jgi:cell division protease FtsH